MNAYERRFVDVTASGADERPEDIAAALADDYEDRGPEAIEDLMDRSPGRFVMAGVGVLKDDRCDPSVRARLAAIFRRAVVEARKRRLH